MRKGYRVFRLWSIAVSMIIVLLVLSVSTYAWFTVNRIVSTDRATARSGTDTLELQISSAGGTSFKGLKEADILQVNHTSLTNLMPVSTADLKTFVYNPVSEGDMATTFRTVENEAYYYHGRFYLRAEAEGRAPGAKMALYLDEENEVGAALAKAEEGMFLNAARLGMTFDGESPVIFALSEEENPTEYQVRNTKWNGTLLGDDQVLGMSEGVITGVKDPAIALSDRTIVMSDTHVTFPAAPLMYMELNRIYTVDVYLYIEGCDPDCSDSIGLQEADLHLAFYGILEE